MASSRGENNVEPIYTTIPNGIPSHVLHKKPTQGKTQNAIFVYNGCLTHEYGPVVINSFLGTWMRIKATVQTQIAIPGISTIQETTRNHMGGPPTANSEGMRIFRIKPITRNGNVNSPILAPLPTNTFNFIPVPPTNGHVGRLYHSIFKFSISFIHHRQCRLP